MPKLDEKQRRAGLDGPHHQIPSVILVEGEKRKLSGRRCKRPSRQRRWSRRCLPPTLLEILGFAPTGTDDRTFVESNPADVVTTLRQSQPQALQV